MLIPTQKAYIRKEESSPTVMCAAPVSRPPLYNTANTMRFPDRPVCKTQQARSTGMYVTADGGTPHINLKRGHTTWRWWQYSPGQRSRPGQRPPYRPGPAHSPLYRHTSSFPASPSQRLAPSGCSQYVPRTAEDMRAKVRQGARWKVSAEVTNKGQR